MTGVGQSEPAIGGPAELTLRGLAASPGVAVGPAFVYRRERQAIDRQATHDPSAEVHRVTLALAATRKDLESLHARAAESVGAEEAAIFEAHLAWLDDPVLVGQIDQRLHETRCSADVAVTDVIDGYAAELEAVSDEYFRARAADLRDLQHQLLDHLQGRGSRGPELADPSVVVAYELTPSDTVKLDRSKVLAFCTAIGGPTAHAAILARSLRLPAVTGLGERLLEIAPGTLLGVDGTTGEIILNPGPTVVARFEEERERLERGAHEAQRKAGEPAITRDGHRVEVVANIGSLAEAQEVHEWGGEGVGLLRTEFLYVNRETPPSEDEQADLYRGIAEALGQQPLIVRTLDIGGDKAVPYLPMEPELNPFLGYRAIRIGLAEPEILRTQLRAILRVGPGHNVKVMFPMVAEISEWRRARSMLETVRADLRREGVPIADPIELGIMLEVPSAAMLADQFAREVDFFSIGTNDLTQYTLAADRTNERVAHMSDPLHPAVLRLIQRVIDAAHAQGKWVGLCGELAGDVQAAAILLGLGLDEFSCSPASIPALKERLRSLDRQSARTLAEECLQLESAAEVRELAAARG